MPSVFVGDLPISNGSQTRTKPEVSASSDRSIQVRDRYSEDALDGEASDEEPSDEETSYYLYQNDSFDPWAASAAFLILAGIALVVNWIPQRSMQSA